MGAACGRRKPPASDEAEVPWPSRGERAKSERTEEPVPVPEKVSKPPSERKKESVVEGKGDEAKPSSATKRELAVKRKDGEAEPSSGKKKEPAVEGKDNEANPSSGNKQEPAVKGKSDKATSQPVAPAAVLEEYDCPTVSKSGCRNCWMKKGTMICRRCNKAKYCSAECQRSHWPSHKTLCGKDNMQLQGVWNTLFMECNQAEGDMAKLRQFVQHVGGDFSYSQNGYKIFHTSIMISGVLRQFPHPPVRAEFEELLQDAASLGADVNAKCSTGDTAMHMALRDGTEEARIIVDFLLQQPQLDLRVKNAEGVQAETLCRTPELRTALARHTRGTGTFSGGS